MLRAPRCSGGVRIASAASTGEVLRTARAGTPARASAPVISRGARMAEKMPSPAPEATGAAGRGRPAPPRPPPPPPRHSEPIARSSARAASPSRGGVLRCLRQDVPQTAGDRGAALRPAATAQAAGASQAGGAAEGGGGDTRGGGAAAAGGTGAGGGVFTGGAGSR